MPNRLAAFAATCLLFTICGCAASGQYADMPEATDSGQTFTLSPNTPIPGSIGSGLVVSTLEPPKAQAPRGVVIFEAWGPAQEIDQTMSPVRGSALSTDPG